MNTKNRIKTMLTITVMAMAIFLMAGSASALDNPGFEVPDYGESNWAYGGDISGASWTFTENAGLSGPGGPWRCTSTSPDPLGDQFAFLQRVSSISQDLTGLEIGATYSLGFFEATRTGYVGNDLTVILDAGLPTEVTIYTSASVINSTWEARTTSPFVPTKTSYTLTFSTSNPLGTDTATIIDGVVLFDSACKVAIFTGTGFNPGDLNWDCLTDLKDYAILAATWLVDYALTAPVAKP